MKSHEATLTVNHMGCRSWTNLRTHASTHTHTHAVQPAFHHLTNMYGKHPQITHTHHLTDVLSCAHTHTDTHTQAAWCALRTELVGIKLFLSPAAHRRRRAGRVGPNAPKIELAQRRSWVLKYKSTFPPVSRSWPLFSGACRDGRLCHS